MTNPNKKQERDVNNQVVSPSQTFRPTAEGLESIAAFIGQGPAH